MDFSQLIKALSDPSAYPYLVKQNVVVHQTHISAVLGSGSVKHKQMLQMPI